MNRATRMKYCLIYYMVNCCIIVVTSITSTIVIIVIITITYIGKLFRSVVACTC